MKKLRTFVLVLSAISLLVMVIVLWIAQTKYEAVFRAPRVPHETFATGDTSVKIVLKPPLAQRRIAQLLLPGYDLPDWVLAMAVPEETAVLIDPDLDNSSMRVRLFVNYARLGPVIRDAINQTGVTRLTPNIEWETPEVVSKERGVLLLDGTAPVSEQTVNGVEGQWTGAGGFAPPDIEGTHVFEAAIENRHGKGFAAIATLVESGGEMDPSAAMVLNPKSFYAVATLRAFADFASEDVANLTVIAEANPAAGPKAPDQIKSFLDLAVGLIKGDLRKKYGVEVEGSSVAEDFTVRGEYTLTGIDALLASATAQQ